MSTPSNIYAEKIFSEHPLALWALDDQSDYISLISEANRDIEGEWAVNGGTLFNSVSESSDPFPNSVKTLLKADVPPNTTTYLTLTSPDIINFQDLNSGLGTFCIGTYYNSIGVYLQDFSIGYEYTDPDTLENIQVFKQYSQVPLGVWSFVSGTFDIPNIDANFRIVFKLHFYPAEGTIDDYQVLFNGITVGQWSEEFNASSLGLDTVVLPSNIALETSDVIEAKQYGISGDSGYYFVSNNSILAKNSGIPLVFGGLNSTKLSINNNAPSLIVPGKGFLNNAGKYNDYTIEFWLKTNCNTITPKRIFGPIASSDGLYVESGFLTLVIGNKFASHFIGEWLRPMLINIRLINNSASLLINGEEVLSLNFETSLLLFPDILNEEGKNQDWLGFYVYEETSPMEIDCIAIYSYNVPTVVSKRRWVYGQAVLSPEKIDSGYNGKSAFIDYPFADYTANYVYPDFAKWDQGTFDNLTIGNIELRTPEYKLPEIFLDTKTLSDWYSDCKAINDEDYSFITFRPNIAWNNLNTYINFPKFNILADEIHTIYGIFKINEDDESKQTLFKIYNTLTGNFFSIKKDGPNIDYYLTYNGVEQEFSSIENFPVGEKIAIGVNIQKIIDIFGGNIAAFFGNRNGLKFYVGGDETGLYQFTGNIYSIGISSAYNANKILSHFDSNGIAIFEDAIDLLEHTASYTLLPTDLYDQFYLDIGVSGYWEDYNPLSYFGQYVKNDIGNEYYELDFLQFNLGYPTPTKTITQDGVKYFDTSGASIKSYVTFQYVVNGANLLSENFTTTILPSESQVIKLKDYPNWQTTKFEVIDNTIIYPSNETDFNSLAIVYHLEFNNRATITKPISLKKLEIASQAFNNNSFNSISTRFGINIFPYKKAGIYYDYKGDNPYSIYKGSTPYLYLTKNSGIEVKKTNDITQERGLAIPVNSSNAANYKVSAFQTWLMSDYDEFSDIPQELFKIEYKNDTIVFYIVANSSLKTRAKIYAKSQNTGNTYNGLAFYLNGNLVNEPVITAREWNVLGITFLTSLNFDNYVGKITLNAPVVFNNIAHYQASSLQEIQSKTTRPWFRVKIAGLTTFDWQYWANAYTWEGVLVIGSTNAYGVDPSNVYKAYTGTNKIIIDDLQGMTLDAEKLKVHKNILWSTTVSTPV